MNFPHPLRMVDIVLVDANGLPPAAEPPEGWDALGARSCRLPRAAGVFDETWEDRDAWAGVDSIGQTWLLLVDSG